MHTAIDVNADNADQEDMRQGKLKAPRDAKQGVKGCSSKRDWHGLKVKATECFCGYQSLVGLDAEAVAIISLAPTPTTPTKDTAPSCASRALLHPRVSWCPFHSLPNEW